MSMFRRLFGQSGDRAKEEDPKPVAPKPESSSPAIDADPTPRTIPEDLPPMGGKEEDTRSLEENGAFVDGTTRRLPLETVIASKNAHLSFGQSTDVGMVRTNNQDAMLSIHFSGHSIDDRPDFGLFVVADGMGGHHDGEKASAIVTRTVAEQVTNSIFLPMLSSNMDPSEYPPITETLTEAIQTANAGVLSSVPDGGTTITAVAIVGDLAYFAHVGDSRAYLVTKDGVEQITRDHSLVQRLIELDQLTPEEAANHPQKNVLYRAIGQSDTLEVDALTRRLPANSQVLLCSDGLWGVVDEDVILQIVRENPDPQDACDKLVAMANSLGGSDNITAIMLRIPS